MNKEAPRDPTSEAALQRKEARTGQIPPEYRRRFTLAMTVAVLGASFGDVSLKHGVTTLQGGSGPVLHAVEQTLRNSLLDTWLIVGIVLMVVHFAGFVRALRLGPLSLVVPLRSASYILTTLLARYFLHETVSAVRWAAILIILAGVSMVGRSGGGEES